MRTRSSKNWHLRWHSVLQQSSLKHAGAAVLKLSPIRNLPTAIAGGFEQRAQIDITLSHIHRVEAQVNRAETVEITLQEDKQ